MKKITKLAALLLLVLSVAACNKEDIVQPVLSDNQELSAFFEENLRIIGNSLRYNELTSTAGKICLSINSMEEFREVASMNNAISTELPAVNFDSHTLVVGYILVPDTGYWIFDQNMVVKSGTPTITLSIEKWGTFVQPAGTALPFWGLYPKLPNASVRVVGDFSSPKNLSFTKYSLSGTSCQWTNTDYDGRGRTILVNSEQELKRYIAGTDYPAIDFTQKTLLIISGRTNDEIVTKEATDFKRLSTRKFGLYATLKLSATRVERNWNLTILVDKISDESYVESKVLIW